MKDKRLKTVYLFENEVDLIVGDEKEKRLADLLRKAEGFSFEDKRLKPF